METANSLSEQAMEEHRAREAHWFSHYDRLKLYLEQNEWEPPTLESNPELYEWLKWQTESIKRTPQSAHWVWKQALLSEVGIDLVRKLVKWRQNFNLLKAHLKTHHGERPNQRTNPQLVSWLTQQRKRYKKAEDKIEWASRVHLLAKLGIDITISANEEKGGINVNSPPRPSQPEERYKAEENFDGSVQGSMSGLDGQGLLGMSPAGYPVETPMDIYATYAGDAASEGITPQQLMYPETPFVSPTTPAKTPKDTKWLAQFERLKSFMEENGGDLPTNKTNQPLYMWLYNQKRNNVAGPHEFPLWKRERLESIGVDIMSAKTPGTRVAKNPKTTTQQLSAKNENRWGRCFQTLKEFMEVHGRPTLQSNPRLYYWLIHQRKHFKKSGDKPQWQRRAARLAEVGINITVGAVDEKNAPDSEQQLHLLQTSETNSHLENPLEDAFAALDEMNRIPPADFDRTSEISESLHELLEHSEDSLLPTPNDQRMPLLGDMAQPEEGGHDEINDDIYQRFNFQRRCCQNVWCAFTNIQAQRLPESIEKSLIAVIASFDSLSLDDKRELLSQWIVDRTKFQIKITATGQTVDICYKAIIRILDLKNESVFLHVLKNSLGEMIDPEEAAKEQLIKNFFVQLESNLKSQQTSSTLVLGRSQRVVYDEYTAYVDSLGGKNHGHNYFCLYWKHHYPHIMASNVPEAPSAACLSSKLPAAQKLDLQAANLLRPSTVQLSRGTATKSTGGYLKKRTFAAMARAEPDIYQRNIVKRPKYIVTPATIPHSTVRARRRKAFFVRRRPVHPVR